MKTTKEIREILSKCQQIRECQKIGISTYYGSDAHSLSSVGNTCQAYFNEILREYNLNDVKRK